MLITVSRRFLHVALVNWDVDLRLASAVGMVPYTSRIVFDVPLRHSASPLFAREQSADARKQCSRWCRVHWRTRTATHLLYGHVRPQVERRSVCR